MFKVTRIIGLLALVVVIALVIFVTPEPEITNFEQCVAAGNPVMESYPRQCRAGDTTFVEPIPPQTGNTPFDTALTMREGEVLRFMDGLSVGLAKIEDSRCPSRQAEADKDGVQCIWAGELKGIFQVIDPTGTAHEMSLATITKTVSVITDYTFTYKDATEHTVTFAVSKKGETIDTGDRGASGIKGTVMLGPTCPVQTNPPDLNCGDRPFATDIFIFQRDNLTTPYKKVQSNAQGEYIATLPPGVYRVRAQGGAVLPYCLEREATVAKDEYVTVAISCDTGIR